MGKRQKKQPPEPGRRLVTRDDQLAFMQKYEEKVVEPRFDVLTNRVQALEAKHRETRTEVDWCIPLLDAALERHQRWLHGLAIYVAALTLSLAVVAWLAVT